MPEPFKNLFSLALIEKMASDIHKNDSTFDKSSFIKRAAFKLDELELKARSEQISEALYAYLPSDFERAGAILLESLAPVSLNQNTDDIGNEGLSAWAIMPLNSYVGKYGLEHFSLSMKLLKEMTKRFSSEFGIRYFLLHDPVATLAVLQEWAVDENYHVRRLASEGSRPRLPWAMQLPEFIKHPQPLVDLLSLMKDDDEEYVRRSVANHLNDIAKDHPELVADIAVSWMKGASKDRQRLVKHACRTLFKDGNTQVLAAFGFQQIRIDDAKLTIDKDLVEMGDAITFSLELQAPTNGKSRKLMIDYVVHHQKANGKTSPKVFKWKNMTQDASETLCLAKRHAFKPISTRVYHSGEHFIEVLVNGNSVARVGFALQVS